MLGVISPLRVEGLLDSCFITRREGFVGCGEGEQ